MTFWKESLFPWLVERVAEGLHRMEVLVEEGPSYCWVQCGCLDWVSRHFYVCAVVEFQIFSEPDQEGACSRDLGSLALDQFSQFEGCFSRCWFGAELIGQPLPGWRFGAFAPGVTSVFRP